MLAAFAADFARARPRWLGYLSTTGVYGDRDGGWVDEGSELAPSTRRGRDRVAAEQAWQRLASDHGLPLHIFRLAGIYGPGRGPFAKLRAGTARREGSSGGRNQASRPIAGRNAQMPYTASMPMWSAMVPATSPMASPVAMCR